MEDENEYKNLPIEDKCVHKLWKARVAGYEEAINLFNNIEDEKSPEWNKYLGLIKKFVTDSNALGQEKGLEAALVFVKYCGHAGKTVREVMSGIVAKCMAAPKTKTKDLALEVALMYVEIGKHVAVQDELIKGLEQKNPKVVAGCIAALTTALNQFGNEVIGVLPIAKMVPLLLADREKAVREETKALVVEMHRWIGAAIEPHIVGLGAVPQQELRSAFAGNGGAQPTRLLRSQQSRQPAAQHVMQGIGAGDAAGADPFDLTDPEDILSKVPKDFYGKVEADKWQERKEALDALEALLKAAPRLAHGDYADLVRALKKVISKDSNVVLVALATRLLAMVATGLRNKFQPYACACMQAILEKFKEKKPHVVAALRDAADAIFPSTNLEVMMEVMMAAFGHKNPSVRAEAAMWLARALARTPPTSFGKNLAKPYVAGLLKLLENSDPAVRDAAAEALGVATKLVGEKAIAPHIGKIDPLKELKIKEAAQRAVIHVKVPAAKKEVQPKAAPKAEAKPTAGSAQPKPVPRPAAATSPPREPDLCPEEVDARAEELLPTDVISGLSDANWKTRLSAVQTYQSLVQGMTSSDATAQLLLKILNKKPGLRDTNAQVLTAKMEVANYVADHFTLSSAAVDSVLQDIVTNLGEASCSGLCARCLTSLAAGQGFGAVGGAAISFAMEHQGSRKVQAGLLRWLAGALEDFAPEINAKALAPILKKALSATNPTTCASGNPVGDELDEDARPPTDLAPLITDEFIAEIHDRNWKVRDEALEKLRAMICTSAPIKASLGELPVALTARLLDSNSKLVLAAIQTCEALASALGPRCKTHVPTLIPAFLQLFADHKSYIRKAAVRCLDAWCLQCGGAASALEGGMVGEALRGGSPVLKITLLTWLATHLPTVPPKSFPLENLSSCVRTLFAALDDYNAELRRAAADCVLPLMVHLGYDAMAEHTVYLKRGCKRVVQAALDKARPLVPAPAQPKAKREDAPNMEQHGKGKVAKPVPRSEKEGEGCTPLLPNNNAKHQRVKVLKWNFSAPRQEHSDLLEEHVASAGFSKQLVANMFHADFRYHLKAIESLAADLPENPSALIDNLDLVLKWLTLRFHDANPSVLLRVLDYLASAFQVLIGEKYTMTVYEANCFVPYLVPKIGDPNDAVRNGVKALFRQIGEVYSVSGLIGFLVDGLESKNARQRAECLACVGRLLETYGDVLQPALKGLAVHLGDGDSAVRSAALDAVAAAYFLMGEKVYKIIGQIADKDLSLLEERIKRGAESRRPCLAPPTAEGKPILQNAEKEADHMETSLGPQPASGPFALDPELLARLDAEVPGPSCPVRPQQVPMPATNISAMPLPAPRAARHPADVAKMLDTIHSIASPDIDAAIRAMSLVSGALASGRGAAVYAHEERFISAITSQVRRLRSTPNDPSSEAYKSLAGTLAAFFEVGGGRPQVGAQALGALFHELVLLLITTRGPGPGAERITRFINSACLTLIEHSPKNALLCAIITLVHQSVEHSDPEYPKYQEMLLKCTWKTMKTMATWEPSSLDYGAVLLRIHRFYKAFPPSYWNDKSPNNMPFKTVKTLIHLLVKLRGASIADHLHHIPDLDESEFCPYLFHVFKEHKLDGKKENTPITEANARLETDAVPPRGGAVAPGDKIALTDSLNENLPRSTLN